MSKTFLLLTNHRLTIIYYKRLQWFVWRLCLRSQREGVNRRISDYQAGAWQLLVPVNRSLACSVVGRKPCLRWILHAGYGYVLLISIATHAGMFRHSRQL